MRIKNTSDAELFRRDAREIFGEEPNCPNCDADPSEYERLIEVADDDDDSVGYHATITVCNLCFDRKYRR